jgi:hypothetical protein
VSRWPGVHGFRRLRPARQFIAVASFLALAGLTCGNPETGTPTDETPSAVPAEVRGTSPTYEDVSARSGIEYVAIAGDTVKNHLLETTGTGIAVGDYDAEGDLGLAVATAQTTSDWLPGRRPRVTSPLPSASSCAVSETCS